MDDHKTDGRSNGHPVRNKQESRVLLEVADFMSGSGWDLNPVGDHCHKARLDS